MNKHLFRSPMTDNRIFSILINLLVPLFLCASRESDSLQLATSKPYIYLEKIPQYVRLKIENDMLLPRDKTDRYFSSGLKADYIFIKNPDKKVWISNIFPRTKSGDEHLGITAAMNMYTPANKAETMTPGDRPYAGWAYIGMMSVSNDLINATRFTSEYSLGMIGPATRQDIIQENFHRIIGRPKPNGWENQIANDIAINLSFVGEKRVLKASDNVDVIGVFETNIGTVSNFIGLGSTVRIGFFEDYFKNIAAISKRSNWQLFVFAKPLVRIVADNALLQGGLFTAKKSPYTIPKDDISRLYMNAEIGYSCSYRNLNITYSQNIRTPEFKGAKNMMWGSVVFSFGF